MRPYNDKHGPEISKQLHKVIRTNPPFKQGRKNEKVFEFYYESDDGPPSIVLHAFRTFRGPSVRQAFRGVMQAFRADGTPFRAGEPVQFAEPQPLVEV